MRRVTAAAFLMVLAVSPTSVRADGAGCGGTWLGSGTCEFVYEGADIEVSGEVLGGGAVAITIDAPGPVLGQPRRVLQPHCVIAPQGTCVHQGTAGPGLALEAGTVLTCRANGLGIGTYYCRNFTP